MSTRARARLSRSLAGWHEYHACTEYSIITNTLRASYSHCTLNMRGRNRLVVYERRQSDLDDGPSRATLSIM